MLPVSSKISRLCSLCPKAKVLNRILGPFLAFLFLEKWAEKSHFCGSVAEGSKALDLGSSLSGGVGSYPTTASSAF